MNTSFVQKAPTFGEQEKYAVETLFDAKNEVPKFMAECKAAGITMMKIIALNQKKQRKDTSFRKLLDPEEGITYCIPIKLLPDGTYKGRKMRIVANRYFDVRKFDEAWAFMICRLSPWIQGSPMGKYYKGMLPLYKVVDEVQDAKSFSSRFDMMMTGWEYIKTLSEPQMLDFALLCNIHKLDNSPSLVLKKLLEYLEKNPAEVNKKFANAEHSNASIILERSIDAQLVRTTPSGLVYDENVNLGIDKEAAVKKILNNAELMSIMNSKSNAKLYKVVGALPLLKMPKVSPAAIEEIKEQEEVAEQLVDEKIDSEAIDVDASLALVSGGNSKTLEKLETEHEVSLSKTSTKVDDDDNDDDLNMFKVNDTTIDTGALSKAGLTSTEKAGGPPWDKNKPTAATEEVVNDKVADTTTDKSAATTAKTKSTDKSKDKNKDQSEK